MYLSPFFSRGLSQSYAEATDGSRQVGAGTGGCCQFIPHATIWSGTPESAIDLHPLASGTSVAYGIRNGEQVGQVGLDAYLWHDTASSAVDLHPSQFSGIMSSLARATDGLQEVGELRLFDLPEMPHAVMWSGTTTSAIDLHSPIYSATSAYGVGGGEQVGYGFGGIAGNHSHALLWHGEPTAVDLHPVNLSGFDLSAAYDTNGIYQVGVALNSSDRIQHAVLWNGSAESAIDLSTLLPFPVVDSQAHSIDATGVVYGTVVDQEGNLRAVKWIPARMASN